MAVRDTIAANQLSTDSLQESIQCMQSFLNMKEGDTRRLKLNASIFALAVSEASLLRFSETVSHHIHSFSNKVLSFPLDISELCAILEAHGGSNFELNGWKEYVSWDFFSVQRDLSAIRAFRNTLNHEPESASLSRVSSLLKSISRILDALCIERGFADRYLLAVDKAKTQSDSILVDLYGEAGPTTMRIGFNPKPLVGREALMRVLVDDILASAVRGDASRTALVGKSGAGKTVLARAVCEALLPHLPFQVQTNPHYLLMKRNIPLSPPA
jgi:hypothetical protein